MRRPSLLAVGMLPPPYGGQAFMFEQAIRVLEADYDVTIINTQLHANIGESGAFALRKVASTLNTLLVKMFPLWLRRQFDVLYFCVSGPSTFGMIKDLLFLTVLRGRARHVVYHFHGTGGVDFVLRKNAFLRAWAKAVLFHPDLALRCANVTPDDAALCCAKRAIIIYNGIEDPFILAPAHGSRDTSELSFVFIGALTEEKGVFDLVEIACLLRDRGYRFTMHIVGEGTQEETSRLDNVIERSDLSGMVKRVGVVVGAEKFRLLKSATLFLFPTFFRAETQPLAAIEAIALGVPVVASDWRGLNTIILHGINGLLVPPRNPVAFCAAVEQTLVEGGIESMRKAARKIFLERFTRERFAQELSLAFRSLG
jgi:glycosyltransferase involved in cell wall biosynthesis